MTDFLSGLAEFLDSGLMILVKLRRLVSMKSAVLLISYNLIDQIDNDNSPIT